MSTYRFVNLQAETALYAGKLEFAVHVKREEVDTFENGQYKTKKIHLMYDLKINGVDQVCYEGPYETDRGPEGSVARLGDIWLSPAAWAEVKPAMERARSNPEYAAQEEARAAAEKRDAAAEAEYRAHAKAVDEMMTLGGKSY